MKLRGANHCDCYNACVSCFWRWVILIGLLEFHIAHPEILLTACANHLLRAKQNAAVETGSGACSLLAKWTLSALVGQRPSSLTINFE